MTRLRAALTDRSGTSRAQEVVRPQPSSSTLARRDGNVTPRRLLGAFYTPDDLATVLTRWALSDGPGTVLDPSYGGSAFLRAAVDILGEHQASNPQRMVFGVDIDPKCVQYAEGLVAPDNHITADFLALKPSAVSGAPFRAVVGNPPYVRHHWLKGKERRAAAEVAERAGVHLRGTASTWAYFVLHALDFLARDGRLALLVPEAILQADYANAIRRALRKRFARVILIHVRDRVFCDTDEPVVVVAAEGVGPGDIRTESIERAADLVSTLEGTVPHTRGRHVIVSNGRGVESEVLELVGDLSRASSVSTLGALATIRIGFVTGSNHFFIRSEKEIERLGLPRRALERVVGRTQWLAGLEFTKDDHRHLTEIGRRTLLVRPTTSMRRLAAVKAWIKGGEGEGVNDRHKCTLREPWFQIDTGPRPDAFVTCSRLNPPLLVLNRSGYRCSNALHALRWSGLLSVAPEVVPVVFLSSLTAVWTEIHGRRYGGGVLKLGLGTLRSTPIPLFRAAGDAFDEVDSLLRAGREESARAAADEAVLRNGLGVSLRDIVRLQRARRSLARQRLPMRSGVNDG